MSEGGDSTSARREGDRRPWPSRSTECTASRSGDLVGDAVGQAARTLDELVYLYDPFLRRFAARRLQPVEIDDVLQNFWLTVCTKRDVDAQLLTWEHDRQRAWLYTTLRNTLMRHSRTAARYRRLRIRIGLTARAQPSFQPADQPSDGGVLARSLARLAPDEREVIEAVRWDEMSLSEVALWLECSYGAARQRYSRALRHLRGIYEQERVR